MKLFIKKGVLFLSIIISLLVLITIVNRALIKYLNPFTLDDNINILILGDSHTKYALNDNILTNACNFSQDADSYFYSFVKLKQIKKNNVQIDTVLLSFSQHNIHKCIENLWLLNNEHLDSRLKLYMPLLSPDDYSFLIKNKPTEVAKGLFNQVLFTAFILGGRKRYGGYQGLNHNILKNEIEKQKKVGFREEYKSFTESPIEIEYLKKIVEYCQTHNLVLILINPPLYKTLQNKQSPLYSTYEKNFSNTLFLDFSKIEMKDSYFGDLVHLTPSGAKYLSELIKNEKLLNIDCARTHNILYK